MLKKRLIKIAKKYPVSRSIRHTYIAQRNNVLRQFYKNVSIDAKTIIFEVFNGHSYSDSPRALFEQMQSDDRFSDYKFIWVFREPAKYEFIESYPRTIVIKYRTSQYYKAYARSKYWITNAMIPLQVFKRDGQILVQCWHGTPLKRLRADIVETTKNAMNTVGDFIKKNDLDVGRYDYMISPSKFASDKFTSAFRLQELNKQSVLIETGYPRNDFLINHTAEDESRIKQSLNLPLNKKILLYAPTWRDDQHDSAKGYVYQSPVDFDYLQRELGDEYVILYRSHYLVANSFDFQSYDGFVYDVSQVDDISQLYVVSDALITDYSSVFFDYANLERPIIFYMYDREYYKNQLRGFYIDVDTLPGDIVETDQALVECLSDLDEYAQTHKLGYNKFNQTYTYLDNGQSGRKVIDIVFGGDKT